MALSLCWMAWSDRVWLFCSSATIRNVTIVVAVLMISCQVSTSPIRKYEGAQTSTSRTQRGEEVGAADEPRRDRRESVERAELAGDLAGHRRLAVRSSLLLPRRESRRASGRSAASNRASTNSSGSNGTRSPSDSPRPTSLTGMPSSVSTANTIPPLAEPSSLVSTTPVSWVASPNWRAWARPF